MHIILPKEIIGVLGYACKLMPKEIIGLLGYACKLTEALRILCPMSIVKT